MPLNLTPQTPKATKDQTNMPKKSRDSAGLQKAVVPWHPSPTRNPSAASRTTSHKVCKIWRTAWTATTIKYTKSYLHNKTSSRTTRSSHVTVASLNRYRIAPRPAMLAPVSSKPAQEARQRRMVAVVPWLHHLLLPQQAIAKTADRLLCLRSNWNRINRIKASWRTRTSTVKSKQATIHTNNNQVTATRFTTRQEIKLARRIKITGAAAYSRSARRHRHWPEGVWQAQLAIVIFSKARERKTIIWWCPRLAILISESPPVLVVNLFSTLIRMAHTQRQITTA